MTKNLMVAASSQNTFIDQPSSTRFWHHLLGKTCQLRLTTSSGSLLSPFPQLQCVLLLVVPVARSTTSSTLLHGQFSVALDLPFSTLRSTTGLTTTTYERVVIDASSALNMHATELSNGTCASSP